MNDMQGAIRAALQANRAKIEILENLESLIMNSHFRSAIRTIQGCRGKVIVSGMGKSGHIGRKIAATFQSTGQRAAFLHPGEAQHGDMGLIGPDDMLVLISNSGQTEELLHVAQFGKAESIPIVVITANAASRLGQMAEMVITYPAMPEGDPLDKAPMASTCAQLALGDAMAAALMELRGFSLAEFHRYHHGGYLGQEIAKIA